MEGWRHRGGKDNRKEVAKEAGEEVQKYKGGRMEREREKGGINWKERQMSGRRREVTRDEKDRRDGAEEREREQ